MENDGNIIPMERLKSILRRINRRGYKAYKQLEGKYQFKDFILFIDHVQADPFASPSRLTVSSPIKDTQIPPHFYSNSTRQIALRDFLTRSFGQMAGQFSKSCGSGHSGRIEIQRCGQTILERNSVVIKNEQLEIRFTVGLPAYGRQIAADKAETILLNYLPQIVKQSVFYEYLPKTELEKHILSYEDQEILRGLLLPKGLVSFIPDGAILPRKSGIDDTPLPTAISFQSPKELRVTFELPYRGLISGMGLPAGITLIAGGGFHGKSTLLKAIAEGIYSHIPGDGREYVVTVSDAIKIRAEEGRRIEQVDISAFINNLPFNKDTRRFSTDNASGSTSQAANIIEAMEIGTHLLLVDEDSSATNFMIRDKRMQELVSKDKEPITPFIDRIQELYKNFGISSILVMGGSGDYLEVADHIIVMDTYQPLYATTKAKAIAQKYPTGRKKEAPSPFNNPSPRIPIGGINAYKGRKKKISANGTKTLIFGKTLIDLSANEHLKEMNQTLFTGHCLDIWQEHLLKQGLTIKQGLAFLENLINAKGLDAVLPHRNGLLARCRPQEIGFALNRLRTLQVKLER